MNIKLMSEQELKENLSAIRLAGMGLYKVNKVIHDTPAFKGVYYAQGEWIVGADGSYMCSICNTVTREGGNFCSHCGAKNIVEPVDFTHADHIRSLNNMELSELFASICRANEDGHEANRPKSADNKKWLEWLNQIW